MTAGVPELVRIPVCISIEVLAFQPRRGFSVGECTNRSPHAVLLRKPTRPRIVVPRSQVVRPTLAVVVLAAVTEGVQVVDAGLVLHAKGVVEIGLDDHALFVRQLDDVTVSIVEVVACLAANARLYQVRAPEVDRGQGVPTVLRDDVPAVYQIHRRDAVHRLDPADTVGVVLVAQVGDDACLVERLRRQLVEAIVGGRLAADGQAVRDLLLGDRVAVGVIRIGRGGQDVALVLQLGEQTVRRVVDVRDGVVFFPCRRQRRAVAPGVIGVGQTRPAGDGLVRQSSEAVIDVGRDGAVQCGFGGPKNDWLLKDSL